jgi:hypothetical protein
MVLPMVAAIHMSHHTGIDRQYVTVYVVLLVQLRIALIVTFFVLLIF